MTTEPVISGPHAGLLEWLARHKVDYEIKEHPLTFTSRATASAEGLDPRVFAKAVGVVTDVGRRAIVTVEASDHVDLLKARRVMGAGRVHLLTEPEMVDLLPGCDTGTVPPIGELVGLPIYADFALRDDREITFHAGSHRFTVTVEREAWERAVKPSYADLAEEKNLEPAWARS